jgi:hypothetical protein
MIISASRRTDIPAFHAEWMMERLREEYVLVRNPFNPNQISRVSLKREDAELIVFWTKNASNMNRFLPELDDMGYPYLFQYTLTPYGRDIEKHVDKRQALDNLLTVAKRIGKKRVIWRYDPIVLTPTYTMEYHVQYFEALVKRLHGYTKTCVISFLDAYRHLQKRNVPPLGEREMIALAEPFSDIARRYGLTLQTCAEAADLSRFGIANGCCIDGNLLETLIGQPLALTKDKNQRQECGCMTSIDIGMYDSCGHGCQYCYANHSAAAVQRNIQNHDPAAPLLYGTIGPEDVVTDRIMTSCKCDQLQLL